MKNLRELREMKRMTQTDVALYCGVSLTAYQLWEKGVNNPNPANLAKLEKLFFDK